MNMILVKTHIQYLEITVICNVTKYLTEITLRDRINNLTPVLANKHNMITQPRARMVYTPYVNILRPHGEILLTNMQLFRKNRIFIIEYDT